MATVAFRPKMGGEWFDIQWRYDPNLVTLIKATIPGPFRTYEPSTHTWSASKTWAQAFAEACKREGHTVSGVTTSVFGRNGRQRALPPLPPAAPVPVLMWADVLLAKCPDAQLRKSVHRALSRVLHPDVAGEVGAQLQKELNAAMAHYRD